MMALIAVGMRSKGKKVLHRNVIGRMTKVENLLMSEWVEAKTAANTPSAANIIPLSNIARKNMGEMCIVAPKGMESSKIKQPLYIPRRDPPNI